jgi:endonuclease III
MPARKRASSKRASGKRASGKPAAAKRPSIMVKAARKAAREQQSHPPAKRPARRPRLRGAALKEQARVVLERLLAEYPDAHCALDHRNAFELLSATILSAQCTDKRVNMVTPALFERYPDARAMSEARPEDVEALVRSAGFFRSKAKSLIGMATAIVDAHGGEVPDEMSSLVVLPGVGRKTANVVLGNAFGRNDGIVVDTHVARLSNRLGLTTATDPVKIEQALIPLFPQDRWTILSHLLIEHGRRICDARTPRCSSCLLADICPSALV